MSDSPISLTPPPAGAADWLGDLKTQIHEAQQRAAQAVNLELVVLYWHRQRHPDSAGRSGVGRQGGGSPGA